MDEDEAWWMYQHLTRGRAMPLEGFAVDSELWSAEMDRCGRHMSLWLRGVRGGMTTCKALVAMRERWQGDPDR